MFVRKAGAYPSEAEFYNIGPWFDICEKGRDSYAEIITMPHYCELAPGDHFHTFILLVTKRVSPIKLKCLS